MSKRALVAGGSLAALTTGILLRQRGWEVDIFERVPEDMSDRGGGITTQEAMWATFAGAGLDVANRPGIRLDTRKVFAADGSVRAAVTREETVTSWDALYRLLRGAFPDEHYHLDHEVEGFEQGDDGVELNFKGGASRSGDLLIAADGVGSAIRGQLLSDVGPSYANYVAWRGLVAEGDMPEIARRDLAGCFSFCLAPYEQMLSYTIPGDNGEDAVGERRHNFVWYRPADEHGVLQDLLTDSEGETHHPNIPPSKIRPEVIAELHRHADATLTPAYAAYVRATKQPFLQPIADHIAPRLAFGRAVLIGDAAAQVRPHTGAGTGKAVADAAALAEALAAEHDVGAALRRFEAERLPRIRDLVEHGRWLGRSLDPANPPGGEDQSCDTLLGVSARGLAGEQPSS